MSRCVMCDWSNDLAIEEGFKTRSMKWDNKESGHVCIECEEAFRDALNEFGEGDAVEGPQLLEDGNVVQNKGNIIFARFERRSP